MPITRNLDDLPTPGSSTAASGWSPDKAPRWAHLLAEKWRADSEAERATHVPSGALFKASDAGKCSRALAYQAVKVCSLVAAALVRSAGHPGEPPVLDETDPMDLTGHWNTTIGRWIHDQWQQAMESDPDVHALFEVKSYFLDGRGVVRVDALIELEKPSPQDPTQPYTIVYEGKSINGYGFKSAIGKVRRGTPAEGPRRGAVLQAAIGGLCAGADEIVVGNWAKETLSGSTYTEVDTLARFVAEWTIPREQFEPAARAEIERVEGILDLLETGLLASRKIPGVPGEIVDPSNGRWEKRDPAGRILDTGTTWECQYCNYRRLCSLTPSGRIAVESVDEAITTLGLPGRTPGPVRGDG